MRTDGLKPIKKWIGSIIRDSLRRKIVVLMMLIFIAAIVRESQNTVSMPIEYFDKEHSLQYLPEYYSDTRVMILDSPGLDERDGFGLDSFYPLPVNESLTMILGSAMGYVLDGEDKSVKKTQDPDLPSIVNALFPMLVDAESLVESNSTYRMMIGDLSAQIRGYEMGHYSCLMFDGTNRGYAIFDVECNKVTFDTFEVRYAEEGPRNGEMTFGTSDQSKEFGAAEIIRVDQELRMFIVRATVFSDTEVVISTSLEGDEMIFTNDGPHTLAFDVQIWKNRIMEDVSQPGTYQLDGWSFSPSREIVIDSEQKIVIYPNDWNDLESARIVFEDGELVIGVYNTFLLIGCAITSFGAVGYWISGWFKREQF